MAIRDRFLLIEFQIPRVVAVDSAVGRPSVPSIAYGPA
jgi:hypothetical protein